MFETSVVERGKIYNIDRYKQLIDFSGLLFHRNITPTDIDGFIDFGGNAFIYMEAKLVEAEVKIGQRIAFENIVKSHERAGHKAVAIIWRHNVPEKEIIQAHTKFVDEYFINHTKHGFYWFSENNNINLLSFIKNITNHWIKMGYEL